VSQTTKLGAVLGSIHLMAYAISLYVSDGGWLRAAIFLFWQIVDLPVSVIIYLSAFTHYWGLIHRIFDDAHIWTALLPLLVVNGVLGTAWWFMLPRFGVWLEELFSS
jgi:hypothetical protein